MVKSYYLENDSVVARIPWWKCLNEPFVSQPSINLALLQTLFQKARPAEANRDSNAEGYSVT